MRRLCPLYLAAIFKLYERGGRRSRGVSDFSPAAPNPAPVATFCAKHHFRPPYCARICRHSESCFLLLIAACFCGRLTAAFRWPQNMPGKGQNVSELHCFFLKAKLWKFLNSAANSASRLCGWFSDCPAAVQYRARSLNYFDALYII